MIHLIYLIEDNWGIEKNFFSEMKWLYIHFRNRSELIDGFIQVSTLWKHLTINPTKNFLNTISSTWRIHFQWTPSHSYRLQITFSIFNSFFFFVLLSEFSATLKVYKSNSWFSPCFRNSFFFLLENNAVFSRYTKFSLFLMCGNWLVHFFIFCSFASLLTLPFWLDTLCVFPFGFLFNGLLSFLRFCIHTTGKM